MNEMIYLPLWQLFLLYLVGAAAVFNLARLIYTRKMQERTIAARMLYFNKGWDAGHSFLQRINDEKNELESAMRILDDKPFDYEESEDGVNAP